MREATMGALSALDDMRPRKAAGPRSAPRAAAPKPASRKSQPEGRWPRLRRFRRRATLLIGIVGFSAIMVGIVLNATVLQKGHHPAPLFATAPPPARVVAAPVPAPAPPPAIPAAAPPAPATATEIPAAPAAPPAPAPRHTAPAASSHPAKGQDGISRFLSGTLHGTPAKPSVHAAPRHATAAATPPSVQAKVPVATAPKRAVPIATTREPTPVN